MNPRKRPDVKHTSEEADDTAAQWREVQTARQDRSRGETMKVFIQQDPSGDYWCKEGRWVGTQELATVYAGVVEALDSCIANCLAQADIVLVFGAGHAEVRLTQTGTRS